MNHSTARPIASSPRSFPEQIVGFGVIALCSFAFASLSLLFFKQGFAWLSASWMIGPPLATLSFGAFHAIFALCFWMIWRCNSLRKLKLELSVFLFGFILEVAWGASLYRMHQLLPSLIVVLLWMCSAIILSALFWKRDRVAGKMLAIPLVWILYLVTMNMMLCIANN